MVKDAPESACNPKMSKSAFQEPTPVRKKHHTNYEDLWGKLSLFENGLHPPCDAVHSSHHSTAQTSSQLVACHPSQSPPPWLSGKCSAQCSLSVSMGDWLEQTKRWRSPDSGVLKLRGLLDNGCITCVCWVPLIHDTYNFNKCDGLNMVLIPWSSVKGVWLLKASYPFTQWELTFAKYDEAWHTWSGTPPRFLVKFCQWHI